MNLPCLATVAVVLFLAGCQGPEAGPVQDRRDLTTHSATATAGAPPGNASVPANASAATMTRLSLHPTLVPGDLALRLNMDFATGRECDFGMAFSGVGRRPVRVLAYTDMPAAPDQGVYLESAFSSMLSVQDGTTHASEEPMGSVLDALGYAAQWSAASDRVRLKAEGAFTITVLATGLGGAREEPLGIDLDCDGDFVLRSVEAGRRVAAWREGRPDEGTGLGASLVPFQPDVSVSRGHRWTFDIGGNTTLVRMFTAASPETVGVEDWQATVAASGGTVRWDETSALGPWGRAYAHDLEGRTIELTLDRVAVGRSMLHGILGAVEPLPDLAALESLLAS